MYFLFKEILIFVNEKQRKNSPKKGKKNEKLKKALFNKFEKSETRRNRGTKTD